MHMSITSLWRKTHQDKREWWEGDGAHFDRNVRKALSKQRPESSVGIPHEKASRKVSQAEGRETAPVHYQTLKTLHQLSHLILTKPLMGKCQHFLICLLST